MLQDTKYINDHKNVSSVSLPSLDLQGAGTDEKVLVEILASRTPEVVNAIKAAYKKGKTVKPYIYSYTHGV